MDEFRTIAKLWPSGTELDLGTDSNVLGGSATFTRNAAQFVIPPNGGDNLQFLFWNTGRHLTNKRRVRWNFSVLGWGTWTATRWYGTPGGTGGPPRVRADAFNIGGDEILTSSTPIDGAASTFAAGSWPFNGNDHEIGTAGGAVVVAAKGPLNGYDFAGWLRLIWGGDPDGEFVESDAGSGGNIGGNGFFEHVAGLTFNVAAGAGADLLAAYGHHDSGGGFGPVREWLENLFKERGPFEIPQKGDPSPIDFIRLKVLEQLVSQTQPAASGGTDFQRLIEAAPRMSSEELKRNLHALKSTQELNKVAQAALEGHLKKGGI